MADGLEGASFWDIGEPRKVVERIENGNRSCEELMSMIQERADVEFRYAKGLREWAKKWDEALMKGSDYGSVLTVWRAVLHEASAVAKIHENCRLRLTGDDGPFYNMYKWKNDHFHRGSFGGLRETREAVEQFAAAQKEYAKLLMKVQRAKRAYYTASVAAYRSRRFADDEVSNEAVSPEARWRLRERADGLVFERERLKQIYLRRVLLCNAAAKERYVEHMTKAFGRWQGFERSRVEQVKTQLLLFVRNINTHSATGLSGVYQHIADQVRGAEPVADVEEWGLKHGTGCQANWPKYEEIDPRTYRETAEELTHHQHRGVVQPGHTTDELTDEFTTDDFDSELDSAKHHAHHQNWPSLQSDRAHHPHQVHKPHRSHQYHVQQYRHHHHRPPGLRYSQNEDLSERWLKDRHKQGGWQGHDVEGVERDWFDGEEEHHQHQHHREDDPKGHNARQWTAPHNVYDDPRDDLHKGQRSREGYHVTGPHSPHTNNEKSHHYIERIDSSYPGHVFSHDPGHVLSHDPGHDLSYNQGHDLGSDLSRSHTNNLPETLAASPSQEFYIHGNHRSSANFKNALHEVGYHRNHESRDVSRSEENIAIEKSSASTVEKHHKQPAENKHRDGQPRQSVPQIASQTAHKQVANYVHHESPPSKSPQGKTQIAPTPKTQQHQAPIRAAVVTPTATPTTTARTYKDGLDAHPQGKAARMEQARQTLQPKDGERLVRALYDFKPATRDEMALKQGEFVVQIGHHLSNGWAYGRKAKVRGHFPASYVQ